MHPLIHLLEDIIMHKYVENRVNQVAEYIVNSKSTVRDTARLFGVSKSTVHKDVSERLILVNPALYQEVRQVLDYNLNERHIRGGLATQRKYKEIQLH